MTEVKGTAYEVIERSGRISMMNKRWFWGLVLIVVGALAMAYQGFTYTTRKKAVDIGSVQIMKKEHHRICVPPLLGAVVLVGGIVLLVTDRHRH